MARLPLVVFCVLVGLVAGCGDDAGVDTGGSTGDTSEEPADGIPRVVDAVAIPRGDGTWRFEVTVSSPYDGPDRYADAWRVLDLEGTELGVRELAHDHADEQPFTRSLDGVEIPDGADVVTIEARDLRDGWSGVTYELELAN